MSAITREEVDEVRNVLNTRIDTMQTNLGEIVDQVKQDIADLRGKVIEELQKPDSWVNTNIANYVTQHSTTTLGPINVQIEQIAADLQKLERAYIGTRSGGSGNGWNIKDPKSRGTIRFLGDQKDDVKVFTTWRKHAIIYLEKFVPNIGKWLMEIIGPKAKEEGYDEVSSLTWYGITGYEEVKDTLHYFLFEHLQDAAADLVESCGTNGVEMWKMICSYYEPASMATHANIHAQVYEMSRRKAKNSAEMHGLLRELERRLTKLSSIDGKIQPEAKASILYNMLDDATQKIVCDANMNGNWDYMRQKVIREGSEFRERAILKHSKTVPMDLDALGRADQDQVEPGAGGGEVNVVHNPNIICYLCKEKGHIARNCPHNTGQQAKGDQRAKGTGK